MFCNHYNELLACFIVNLFKFIKSNVSSIEYRVSNKILVSKSIEPMNCGINPALQVTQPTNKWGDFLWEKLVSLDKLPMNVIQ